MPTDGRTQLITDKGGLGPSPQKIKLSDFRTVGPDLHNPRVIEAIRFQNRNSEGRRDHCFIERVHAAPLIILHDAHELLPPIASPGGNRVIPDCHRQGLSPLHPSRVSVSL